jgi:hypothetical protein
MTNHERLMTAAGPAGVVLLLAGNGMAGAGMPGIDANDRELQTYLDGLDPAWLGSTLEIFGLVALLVFSVALSRRVADGALRSLVLAGGVAGVAVKLATALPLMAVWLRPEAVDPALAGVALDLGSIGFAAGGALFALMPAGLAAASVLPRWLSIGGAVTALALLAQVPLFRQEFGLGFLLFMLWTIAAGVTLMRDRPRSAASRSPHGDALPRPA